MRIRRRLWTFLVVVLVLVSVYLNLKPSSNRTNSSSEIAKDRSVSWQVGKHALDDVENIANGTTIDKPTAYHGVFVKSSNSAAHRDKYKLLQRRLVQLEKKLNESQLTSRVLFMGSSKVLNVEIPLYKPILNKLGYEVYTMADEVNEISSWRILMCYTGKYVETVKKDCIRRDRYGRLTLHQKISNIPGLVKVFLPPKRFSFTMSQLLHISALSKSPITVPCFTLPPKHKLNLVNYLMKSTGNNSVFVVQTMHSLGFFNMKVAPRNLQENGILQVIPQPLLYRGHPVVVKLYVLVTSISPLRVYRHHDGNALIMALNEHQIKEIWTIEKFDLYLSKHNPNFDEHHSVWSLVESIIVHTLMGSESLLSSNNLARSKNGFQLLEFHFTFNSSLYPFLLKVNPPDPGSTLPVIVNDTMGLLLTLMSSYSHVADALEKLKNSIGVEGINCNKEQTVCLNELELIYLLETRRESTVIHGFKKLYPTHDSDRYRTLLDELRSSNVDMIIGNNRGTPHLHSALLLLENYGNQGTHHIVTQNVDKRKGYWETDDEDDTAEKTIEDGDVSQSHLDNCDDDPSTIPVLTGIFTDPGTSLKPAFDSEIFEYDLFYPFNVMVVKLWGQTSTCLSEARVNSKAKTSKMPVNYSLGVGWNRFVIHHVSNGQSVLGTYKINIYRQTASEGQQPFDSRSPHEMCTVKQDCDLKVFPDVPCGPIRLLQNSYQTFQQSREGLPFCESGQDPGSWVLPCDKCSQPSSCYWNEALWTPESCQHRLLTTKQAKTCLAKKKILFVGDSTNRGMMYYLLEKINGSLRQWEKTHSMKVYSSNEDQTSVSFAYFPQFWLPSDRKPVFLKALHHLMAKFMPLSNSTDTVLVVGGVQWLLPSHVNAIKSTINSLGLSGIKVIIKSLGSGFHLPVPGFVELGLEGQRNVSRRNKLLVKTALAAGFEVIDTHVMTISRYKEFVMGKCGCHFHKVVDVRLHTREDYEDKTVLDDDSSSMPRYHVIGNINSAYADIMISRMCS